MGGESASAHDPKRKTGLSTDAISDLAAQPLSVSEQQQASVAAAMLRNFWEAFGLIACCCAAFQLIGRAASDAEPPAAECNNGRGECKLLRHCPPLQMSLSNVNFCDPAAYTVCCPKKKVSNRNRYTENADTRPVKECNAYRERVYRSCGDQPLIVGGIKAEPRELPHMALLGVYDAASDTYEWRCGGTLIHPRFVLSAAHCFLDHPLVNHIRLGELDYSRTTDDARPQDFSVLTYHKHPQYDDETYYNDIVVIQLNGTAELSEYVVPACLPQTNGSELSSFLAAGWGNTKVASHSEHLLKVHLDKFTYEECKEKVEVDEELEHGILQRTQICAGSHTGAHDTCTGDSGGPLFSRHPKYPCMYQIFGVTSFGSLCGVRGFPAVYTRIALYMEWIERLIYDTTTWL